MRRRALCAVIALAGAYGCSSDEATTAAPGTGGAGALDGSSTGGKPSGGASGQGGTGGSVGGQSSGGASGTGGGGTNDASVDHGGTDGAAREGGGDATSGSDVTGTVTNAGGPAPNIPVIVDGVAYVTDAQGKFTAKGIGTTYDATVIYTGNRQTFVDVYLGLATRSPIIQVAADVLVQSATVSGRLSGGSGFPNGAAERAAVAGVRPGDVLGLFTLGASEGPAYGPLTLRWANKASIDATLFALQWNVDSTGLPAGYDGWSTKTLTVSDGGSFGQSDGGTPATELALGAVSSRSLSGTAQVPSGLTISRKALLVGGVGAIRVFNDTSSAASFQYLAPTGLAPVETSFRIVADGQNGEAADTTIRVDDSTTTLDLNLLAVPVPVLPVAGATQVDYTTPFTFTGPSNTVHSIQVWDTPTTVTFTIYTMGTTVKIPDLTAAGIPLKRGGSYTWVAAADDPATRVEDLLLRAPAFYEAHGKRSHSFSAERTFTVAN